MIPTTFPLYVLRTASGRLVLPIHLQGNSAYRVELQADGRILFRGIDSSDVTPARGARFTAYYDQAVGQSMAEEVGATLQTIQDKAEFLAVLREAVKTAGRRTLYYLPQKTPPKPKGYAQRGRPPGGG